MTTTTRQIDPAKILNKAVQKLAETTDEYDAVTSTITTQKRGQEIDYDDLVDRLSACMSTMRSIKAASRRLAAKQTEIPGMVAYATSLIDAAEAFEKVLMGLRRMAQLTGGYGYFRYRREYRDFQDKHQAALIARYEYNEQLQHFSTGSSPQGESATTGLVADMFVALFEKNIGEDTDVFLRPLTEERSTATMKVDEKEAREAVFYALLTFWIMPVWDCFEDEVADEIITRIFTVVSRVYGLDVKKLASRVLSTRNHYANTFETNARLRRNSAWIVDDLADGVSLLTYQYIDTTMVESMPIQWDKLADQLTVVRNN